uniref:Uncharacterized protein n=1 Tax=Sphaerodactylus townsendi TaxID=933632 RepID=A0ACB8G2E7_9SAUR
MHSSDVTMKLPCSIGHCCCPSGSANRSLPSFPLTGGAGGDSSCRGGLFPGRVASTPWLWCGLDGASASSGEEENPPPTPSCRRSLLYLQDLIKAAITSTT